MVKAKVPAGRDSLDGRGALLNRLNHSGRFIEKVLVTGIIKSHYWTR